MREPAQAAACTPRVIHRARHGATGAGPKALYATASIASGVSFTVVRRSSRGSFRSKRRPR